LAAKGRLEQRIRKPVEDIVDFRKLVAGQESDTLLITYADSRVVSDQLVSTDPGALFVMRNAGNLIPRGCARNSAITNPPNRRHASHCIAHLAVP
jgi:carbonic anhydrase